MIFHQPHNSIGGLNYNGSFYKNTIWEPHFHKNYEIVYVIKGTLNCTVNGKDFVLNAGDYGICISYAVHSYFPQTDCEYWVGVFSSDYVNTFSNRIKAKTADGFSFKCEKEIDSLVKKYLIRKEVPDTIQLKFCLYALCNEILLQIPFTEQKKENTITAEIIDFISENHKNKISLTDLSDRLGYDYHYVSRLFNNTFNISFNDFINLYRLETAANMLIHTDKKIFDIALECGFQSIRSFNDCFSKNLGCTPSDYKKSKK